MAERPRLHEWINTSIAGFALLVAGAAAYFSWQANQMKRESLAIVAQSTDNCPFDLNQNFEVTLCWLVILSNRSEDRLSIVDYHVQQVFSETGSTEEFAPYENLETADGKPLSLPINLDGGEGKQILVRVLTRVTQDVSAVITQMPEYKASPRVLSLRKVEEALAAQSLDIVGNRLPYTAAHPVKSATHLLTLLTGRGSTFNQSLTYDPSGGFI